MKYSSLAINQPLDASLVLPGSKSITNRALILAALATGESVLKGLLLSDDTLTCLNALKNLGVKMELDEKKQQCYIQGVADKFPNKKAEIWCQDAGTVARFLLAACALNTNAEYYFSGTPRLQSRPIKPLLVALKEQGAVIISDETAMPLTLIKKNNCLRGGEIFISGEESSQFLSALLMIAPYAKNPTTLRTDNLVSAPYIQLTCQMMRQFGVEVIQEDEQAFLVKPAKYSGRVYEIEPDLSTASYFFAAAAVRQGKITVKNIDKNNCLQGDIAFLNVLEEMGCRIKYDANAVTVFGPEKLQGITVNMNNISDTMMTLACIAPFAETPTTITHIEHVRYKESDRIEAVVCNLEKLGIKTVSGNDYLTIFPGPMKPAQIGSYNDHRIAMAFSLVGLCLPGLVIQGMECVSKTCPNFIELWSSLLL